MNIVQIDNWQEYLRDGEQFLKTARGAYHKKSRAFSPDTLYNVVCMGIEKLTMAFLMKNGDLAENHTMGDLLFALERHLGPVPSLSRDLRYLDSFQEICDLETYTIHVPNSDNILEFLRIADEVQNLLLPHLKEN